MQLAIMKQVEGEYASFRRDKKDNRLGYSDLLSFPILLDTGAEFGVITPEGLEEILAHGGSCEEIPVDHILNYSDGSTDHFDKIYLVSFFLTSGLYVRSLPIYVGYRSDKSMLLGLDLMRRMTIEYTPDTIRLLKSCPEEQAEKFPLVKGEDNRYYVTLSVNGRENQYFLDTGLYDDIRQPLEDIQYAEGSITEVHDTLYVGSHSREIIDYKESRATVKIGDIVRRGPVVYNDYFIKRRYWINPCSIFRRFAIDLQNKQLLIYSSQA